LLGEHGVIVSKQQLLFTEEGVAEGVHGLVNDLGELLFSRQVFAAQNVVNLVID